MPSGALSSSASLQPRSKTAPLPGVTWRLWGGVLGPTPMFHPLGGPQISLKPILSPRSPPPPFSPPGPHCPPPPGALCKAVEDSHSFFRSCPSPAATPAAPGRVPSCPALSCCTEPCGFLPARTVPSKAGTLVWASGALSNRPCTPGLDTKVSCSSRMRYFPGALLTEVHFINRLKEKTGMLISKMLTTHWIKTHQHF